MGHIPVGMLTAGLIDRAIDQWEVKLGSSTVKNTVSALVLVLDEAVRDDLLARNPAKNRGGEGLWVVRTALLRWRTLATWPCPMLQLLTVLLRRWLLRGAIDAGATW